jgi:hypothetical protein
LDPHDGSPHKRKAFQQPLWGKVSSVDHAIHARFGIIGLRDGITHPRHGKAHPCTGINLPLLGKIRPLTETIIHFPGNIHPRGGRTSLRHGKTHPRGLSAQAFLASARRAAHVNPRAARHLRCSTTLPRRSTARPRNGSTRHALLSARRTAQ